MGRGMTSNPKILGVKTLATSRLFRIEEVGLRFANGAEATYERIQGLSSGAVLVVALRDPETFLLVREYAVGVERYELGLPKGRVEPGEAVLATANRELMEEVGFGARRLTALGALSLSPGYFGHLTHIVLAEDLYPERRQGDEPEPVEVVPWRFDELPGLMDRSDFSEARSIAALYMVRERLSNER